MSLHAGFGAGAAAASPGRTICEVVGAATIRGQIYEVTFSSDGTPADNAFIWKVMRRTVAGTATAFTPTNVDPTDPRTAVCTVNANASAEPTVTANSELLDFALNMRATYRWVANPGAEWRTPAVAANGIVMRCQHASSTASNRASVSWSE